MKKILSLFLCLFTSLFAIGADTPNFKIYKKPVPLEKKLVITKIYDKDYHIHKCSKGHEWSHHNDSRGDLAKHTCPICGEINWSPSERNKKIIKEKK